MAIVADASVILAWCFADEDSDLAIGALKVALQEGLVVPSIWTYEVSNSLTGALRRGRIVPIDLANITQLLSRPAVRTVEVELDELLGAVATLARENDLTTYDASYLYVASREALPLATLDRRLRAAAEAAGCKLFE